MVNNDISATGKGRITTTSSSPKQGIKRMRTEQMNVNGQIPIRNYFSPLSGVTEMVSTASQNDQVENVTVRNKKMPPLTVKNVRIQDLKDLIRRAPNMNEQNIHLRITSVGIKIFTYNNEDYTNMYKICISEKHEFFTHTLNENRKVKICLYGLYKMEKSEIEAELALVGVKPADIKMIETRRNSEDCIYVLHFWKRDQMKLNELRSIKTVASCIVRFNYYSPKQKGPTQCAKCQEFGHGSQNCHLKARCIRCAEQHDSNQCTYLPKRMSDKGNEVPDITQKVPVSKLKCANCKKPGHTANYKGCEARIYYINIQNNTRNRNDVKQKPSRAAPLFDEQNFPRLPRQTPHTQDDSRENPWHRNPGTNPNKLFSTTECMQIFNDVINKLAQCQTHQEQTSTITEIALKYFYGPK